MGLPLAQVALHFGANDVQGTVVREKIFHAAGATTGTEQKVAELVALRARGGPHPGAARQPLQRDPPMVNLAEIELAPDVVWVGVRPGMLCRSAEQVRARLEQVQNSGRSYSPEVLAERDGVVLYDPHVDPPAQIPELHQIADRPRQRRAGDPRLPEPGRRAGGVRGDAVIRLGRIAYVNMAPVFYRVDAEVEEVHGRPDRAEPDARRGRARHRADLVDRVRAPRRHAAAAAAPVRRLGGRRRLDPARVARAARAGAHRRRHARVARPRSR